MKAGSNNMPILLTYSPVSSVADVGLPTPHRLHIHLTSRTTVTQQQQTRRGPTVMMELEVSLSDMYVFPVAIMSLFRGAYSFSGTRELISTCVFPFVRSL